MAHHLEHFIELRHPAIGAVRGICSPAVSFLDIRLHQLLGVGRGESD